MRAKFPTRARLAAVVALLAAMTPQVQAAEPVIDLIPADTELLVGLNVRLLMDSPLFNAIVDQSLGRKQFEGEIQKIKAMSAIDLRRDVNRVYWFGRMDKVARGEGPPEGVWLAEGQFNEEALLALAREERGYGTVEAGGRTIHVWTQGRHSRGACFLSDSRLLICEDGDGLAAYLEALDKGRIAAGSKENIRSVLKELDRNALLLFFEPEDRPHVANPPGRAKYGFKPSPVEAFLMGSVGAAPQVQSTRLVVGLESDEVVADMRFAFKQAEEAQNVLAIAAGALAFLRMATAENPEARAYLNAIEIGYGEDQQSLRASIRIKNDAIVEALTEAKATAASEKIAAAAKDAQEALEQVVRAQKDTRTPAPEAKPAQAAPDVSAELEKIQRQLDALQKTLEQMKAVRAKSGTATPEGK